MSSYSKTIQGVKGGSRRIFCTFKERDTKKYSNKLDVLPTTHSNYLLLQTKYMNDQLISRTYSTASLLKQP